MFVTAQRLQVKTYLYTITLLQALGIVTRSYVVAVLISFPETLQPIASADFDELLRRRLVASVKLVHKYI